MLHCPICCLVQWCYFLSTCRCWCGCRKCCWRRSTSSALENESTLSCWLFVMCGVYFQLVHAVWNVHLVIKLAAVVNSSLVDDPTIRQPGFDLPRHYWALLNRLQTNQGQYASYRKKWGLAATDMCPCGKCQTMSHIVNSCPQSKLEGAAAIVLSWWHCYWMAEDIAYGL